MDPTIVASPSRRHYFQPRPAHLRKMSNSRPATTITTTTSTTKCTILTSTSLFPSSSASKRSFSNTDLENSIFCDPPSPPKKSKPSFSSTKPLSTQRTVFSSPIRSPKRAFGTDVTNSAPSKSSLPSKYSLHDIENIKPASPSPSSRKILKPLSVIKRASNSPPSSPPTPLLRPPSPRLGSGRGQKRPALNNEARRRKPIRIDPPKRASPVSDLTIDSLLLPPRARLATNPPLPVLTFPLPAAWDFKIYEDTPEDTLTNILNHTVTCSLDISDSSDTEDFSPAAEIKEKGKENIPPTRLEELTALTAEERESAMVIECEKPEVPQKKKGMGEGAGPGGRVLKERREVLRELEAEELIEVGGKGLDDDEGEGGLPELLLTPVQKGVKRKDVMTSPLRFEIYEDEGDKGEESGVKLGGAGGLKVAEVRRCRGKSPRFEVEEAVGRIEAEKGLWDSDDE